MNHVTPTSSPKLPTLIAASERASLRLLEFFIGHPEHGAGWLP